MLRQDNERVESNDGYDADTMRSVGMMLVLISLRRIIIHLHPPDRQDTNEHHLLSSRHLQSPDTVDRQRSQQDVGENAHRRVDEPNAVSLLAPQEPFGPHHF
jgi:hypothetical protein